MNMTQKCILYIAKEADRICKKNNICYSIIAGTMLGAVRHKGFIPWDDDMDFAMLRGEYERFVEACKTDLGPEFVLQTSESDEDYCFAFCKIRLKNTHCVEDFAKGSKALDGLWLDIFPLDAVPNDRLKAFLLKKTNHVLKNLIWVKCGYGTDQQKKQIKYCCLKLAGAAFPISFLKEKRKLIIQHYNGQQTTKLFSSDYPKTVYLRSWFEDYKTYLFEDSAFFGIAEADHYLSKRYGDYMILPPKGQRNGHLLQNVDYGPYMDDGFLR